MTHKLASGNKIVVDRNVALLVNASGQVIEVSPRKAVVLVLRDTTLRGNPHFDHDFSKGVDR